MSDFTVTRLSIDPMNSCVMVMVMVMEMVTAMVMRKVIGIWMGM